MHELPTQIRDLVFHPRLEPLELLLRTSGLPNSLARGQRNEITRKLMLYSLGQTRRNSDHKKLTGFLEWHLIELRWDWELGDSRVPVRLIGSEIDSQRTVFCVWHIKNPEIGLDQQRQQQNMACAMAVERVRELENSSD